MKKITIEISRLDGSEINGGDSAWELIALAKLISQPAYKSDENSIRNRLAWYTAEEPENVVTVKLS